MRPAGVHGASRLDRPTTSGIAHGIHFNDEELRVLAKTGTGVCHCPISNMKLSSGIARIPEMLELGVPVGLGVDGSASNDGSSLMEELRVAYPAPPPELQQGGPHAAMTC